MKLPEFDYAAPSSATEVVALLAARSGSAKVLAGGQSLLPAMAFRLARPALLVDLRNVPGLDRITIDDTGIALGARVRWCDIERDHRLAAACPLLAAAIRHVAHYAVRNRGTVGGSLAHADPAAEMPCIAVTCEATLRLLSPRGERRLPAAAFFHGPLMTALADDEIILEALLPRWPAARRWAFQEFSRRRGDFALAGVALHYDPDAADFARGVHIGVLGACHQPRRLALAERAIEGKPVDVATAAAAASAAASEADAVADMHADADYRRALVATLVERALLEAAQRRP